MRFCTLLHSKFQIRDWLKLTSAERRLVKLLADVTFSQSQIWNLEWSEGQKCTKISATIINFSQASYGSSCDFFHFGLHSVDFWLFRVLSTCMVSGDFENFTWSNINCGTSFTKVFLYFEHLTYKIESLLWCLFSMVYSSLPILYTLDPVFLPSTISILLLYWHDALKWCT